MKGLDVLWKDASILHSEHLDLADSYNKNWIMQIIKSQGFFNFGIENIRINLAELANGKILIEEMSCLFQDGTYINYNKSVQVFSNIRGSSNGIYSIFLDLNNIRENFFNCKKIFLCRTDDFIILSEDRMKEDGEIVKLFSKTPVLTLLVEENFISSGYVGFPILEIRAKGGIFETTKYISPSLRVGNYVLDKLENLSISIRRLYLNTRDIAQMNEVKKEDLLFFKTLGEILIILDSTMKNKKTYFEVYNLLVLIISNLQWKSFGVPSSIPMYDHNNILEVFNNLFSSIYDILEGLAEQYIRRDFIFYQNSFSAIIPAETFRNEILLVLEPNTKEVLDWILKARIYSRNLEKSVLEKRVKGAYREIEKNDGKVLIIKIKKDEWIRLDEELIIYSEGSQCIKRLSLILQER